MFGLSFSELLVIALVALVVLGPERLPKAARFAGLWVRRARTQWESVKQELERELEADELKRELQAAQDSLRQVESQLRQESDQVRREGQALKQAVQQDIATSADHADASAAAPPASLAAPSATATGVADAAATANTPLPPQDGAALQPAVPEPAAAGHERKEGA
ncbi:Sec-independent protein translocase protein TatB [Stenotrophomonas sp. MMGLT7]|uniref:Sec-independent protein translocase protein TatB n=1 Tax=Stenotrophomonas sp. MMGLT7 TaxID=2901227 RepID=UPI001E426FC2|nr:Sec-independent protein translocase protein TatB [Stenotrophomonas sp. MMGLT7]